MPKIQHTFLNVSEFNATLICSIWKIIPYSVLRNCPSVLKKNVKSWAEIQVELFLLNSLILEFEHRSIFQTCILVFLLLSPY